jgi:hypothetical protein
MDCYQGEVKYCHSWVDQPSHHRSLDEIMRPWIEDGKNLLPNVRNLKAASGPLVGVFGTLTQEEGRSQTCPYTRVIGDGHDKRGPGFL